MITAKAKRYSHFVSPSLLLLTTLLVGAQPAQAQFRLPKPPKVGVPEVKIPGLDKLLKEEEPLTTVIADSFAPIPFLDDFVPYEPAALPELPLGVNDEYLYLPGIYEIRAESYCLKAGTYVPRPGSKGFAGRGYLYAPLKGPKAAIIDRIIKATMYHPEVPQHDTQVLLWAIIARAKLSDSPPALLETARKLLDEKDLRALGDNTLGVLPPEVQQKLMEKMPPLVRTAFEAENRLREELKNRASDVTAPVNTAVDAVNAAGDDATAPASELYRRMEQIAVLTGEPPELPVKDQIPWGRWTYHPSGYFLRLLPQGYATTVRQVYHPEQYTITRDAQGRIESLKAPDEDTVFFVYDGNGRMLKAVRLVRVNPAQPEAPFTATFETATPINLDAAGASFAETLQGMQEALKRQQSALGSNGDMGEQLQQLARLRSATRAILKENEAGLSKDKDWCRRVSDKVTFAWMSTMARSASGDRIVAMLPLPQEEPRNRSTRLVRRAGQGGWSGGGGGGFSGGGGGGAGMPGPGGQRLGQGNKKKSSPNSIDKARQAGSLLNKGTGKFIRNNGLSIPSALANWHFNWLLDNGQKMSDAISMDPPRADFTVYARPDRIATPKLPTDLKNISPERRAAFESLLDSLLDMRANLVAGVVSIDRHGGAKQARDEKWTYAQACALAHYKREAGKAMLVAADRMERYAALLEKENIPDQALGSQEVQAYKERLEKSGFTAEEKQAARDIGLTDSEIAASLQERINATTYPVGLTEKQALRDIAVGLRELGEYYLRLYPVTLPSASNDAVKTARVTTPSSEHLAAAR